MATPLTPVQLPSALEYLRTANKLLLCQNLQTSDSTKVRDDNGYLVKTSEGQLIFIMTEQQERLMKLLCISNRGFTMNVFDKYGEKFMTFVRPCMCFQDRIDVFAPPGNICGTVEQSNPCCTPTFLIFNTNRHLQLVIRGKRCPTICSSELDFDVITPKGKVAGCIQKYWNERFKDVYEIIRFTVSFPVDLDIRIKATVLAASILIDFRYFKTYL